MWSFKACTKTWFALTKCIKNAGSLSRRTVQVFNCYIHKIGKDAKKYGGKEFIRREIEKDNRKIRSDLQKYVWNEKHDADQMIQKEQAVAAPKSTLGALLNEAELTESIEDFWGGGAAC